MASRVGNFSSSEIWKLMSNGKKAGELGKPALTYIKEKSYEIRLGRALTNEVSAKPTNWGTLMELYAFQMLLGIKYRLEHKTRFEAKGFNHWNGCPDLISDDSVGDIKSPYTLKSAIELIDSFHSLEMFKAHSPEYYWQLVSNAVLTEKSKAELIVFVPYKQEIQRIKDWMNTTDAFVQNGLDQNKFAFIDFAQEDDLPYFNEDSEFQNITAFEFEIPTEDIEALKERVKTAEMMLNELLKTRTNI